MFRASDDPDLILSAPDEPVPRSKPSLAAGVRVMTLNLAHGRKLAFHQALLSRRRFAKNLRHVGDILRREAPDVVTLQEADGPSVWSGSFDHVDSLARYAGFDFILRGRHVAVGWPLVLDYGTAIVSRLPVNEEQSVRFAQAPYDTKGFVRATVLAPELGGLVDVVSVHLDFLSRGTRWRQVEILQRALVDRPHPLILAGDFNSEWQDTTCVAWLADVLDLVAWAPDAGEPTFPNRKPQARLDWILVSEDLRFDSYATLSDRVSDHRGVVARLSRKTPASSR